jgi:hypothetical protein
MSSENDWRLSIKNDIWLVPDWTRSLQRPPSLLQRPMQIQLVVSIWRLFRRWRVPGSDLTIAIYAGIRYLLFTHVDENANIKNFYLKVQMKIMILGYVDANNNRIRKLFISNIYFFFFFFFLCIFHLWICNI